jgi:serine/threonine protein kinase/Flp pilus assembly protein TadD
MKCPNCRADNPETVKFCGECGSALSPAEPIPSRTETLASPLQELNRGAIVAGRYEIIEELGHGGMGKVYRVEDTKIKAEIALKLIKPEISADRKTIERFANELKTTRMISHRNVCRMFDLGEDKGTYFITMEYVPGQDLRGLIRQTGQLTIGKAVAIAKQITEGLTEAHRLGVIHRDLKPSNIIIDKDGNARIMDFGIARSIRGKSLTGEGMIIGTPEYMSPEQVEGKEADQRSDIYSLGTILYEMLTGRVPFEGDTPLSVAVKQKAEKPQEPKELNEQIPDDLNRLILRCLEKDRGRRYQSAEELRSGLENIEKGLPATTHEMPRRKPFTSKQVTVTIGPKKLLIPALGVLALVILGVVVWRILPKGHFAPLPPSGKPTLAILYFENLSSDRSLDPWKTALTELLITKLSQSKYINVLSSDRIFSLLKRLNLQEARKYSTEDLVKVAAESGATYTLSGSLMKAGQNIIMTLTLQKPRTGEVISPLNVECSGEEEIFPKVDELARTIKSDLNLTPDQIATDIDKETGQITTSSPEAYKYYGLGRQYHARGDYEQSIALMEKAVSIDPAFAMAYRSLAVSSYNLGYTAKYKSNMQKALELSDRTSDREHYLILGDLYSATLKTYDRALEAYTKLLALYPDDILGNLELGVTYADLEEWDKAIERYEACIRLKDPSYQPYGNIAFVYENLGKYEEARQILEDYSKNFSDTAMLRRELAYAYLYERKYGQALEEANKAFSMEPTEYQNNNLSGDIRFFKDDLIGAEKEFQKSAALAPEERKVFGLFRLGALSFMEGKFGRSRDYLRKALEYSEQAGEASWESVFHFWLAGSHLSSGNCAEAAHECDQGWQKAVEAEDPIWQRFILHMRGLVEIRIKSIAQAQKTADELKELVDKGLSKKEIRLYHHLQGLIEFEKGNNANAIEYLGKAVSSLPAQSSASMWDAVFIDSLAMVYLKTGNLDDARKEYENIVALTSGRLGWGEIYAKSFYMLGKIAEQQGDKARARENYQKFLDLWKNADPGLPEPAAVRKRLREIGN